MKNTKHKLTISIALSVLVLLILFIYIYIKQERVKEIYIEKIQIPSNLYGIFNAEDYPNTEIIYTLSNDTKIDIYFKEEITIDDIEDVYFFQGGKFIPVDYEKNENDNTYFHYSISKKKLEIYGENNVFPTGPTWLSVIIKNNKGVTIENDIILSPNSLTPHLGLQWTNQVNRTQSSLVLPKQKNDNKEIAFVKNETSKLYKDNSSNNVLLELDRGESVQIISSENNKYFVRLFLAQGIFYETLNYKTDIFSDTYTTIIEGWIDKHDLQLIPEPMNNHTVYSISRNDSMTTEEVGPDLVINVLAPILGQQSIFMSDKTITDDNFTSLEAISIWQWLSMLPGTGYWSSYASDNGEPISKLDSRSHLPEYNWTNLQYQNYQKYYNKYTSWILRMLSKYEVPEEYLEYKKHIYPEQINKRILLQQAWIEWGVNDKKLTPNWFIHDIKNKFIENIPNINSELLNDFVNSELTITGEEEFNEWIETFINMFVTSPEMGNIINETIERVMANSSDEKSWSIIVDDEVVEVNNSISNETSNNKDTEEIIPIVLLEKKENDLFLAVDENGNEIILEIQLISLAPDLQVGNKYLVLAYKSFDDTLGVDIWITEGDQVRPILDDGV